MCIDTRKLNGVNNFRRTVESLQSNFTEQTPLQLDINNLTLTLQMLTYSSERHWHPCNWRSQLSSQNYEHVLGLRSSAS